MNAQLINPHTEPRMKTHQTLLATTATLMLAACAATPPTDPKTASAPQAGTECVKTTGSNICRASGSGNMNSVDSISGEDLRRSGGPITGATPGRVGN
jgi:uncharacterized lipoprotein YajG